MVRLGLVQFQLAIEYGIKFMETSAKSSINVEEGFFTLARDIKAKMDRKLVCIEQVFSLQHHFTVVQNLHFHDILHKLKRDSLW